MDGSERILTQDFLSEINPGWLGEIDCGLTSPSMKEKMAFTHLTAHDNFLFDPPTLSPSSSDKACYGNMGELVEDYFNMLKTESSFDTPLEGNDIKTDENFEAVDYFILDNAVKSENYPIFDNTCCLDKDEKPLTEGDFDASFFVDDNMKVENNLFLENQCDLSNKEFFSCGELATPCDTDFLHEKYSSEISESFVNELEEIVQLIKREDEIADTLQTEASLKSPRHLSGKCNTESELLIDVDSPLFGELNDCHFPYTNILQSDVAESIVSPRSFNDNRGLVVTVTQHHDTDSQNTSSRVECVNSHFRVSLIGGFKMYLPAPVPLHPTDNNLPLTSKNSGCTDSLLVPSNTNLNGKPLSPGLKNAQEIDKSLEDIMCCVQTESPNKLDDYLNKDLTKNIQYSAISDLSFPILSCSSSNVHDNINLNKSIDMTCNETYYPCNMSSKKQKTISVLSFNVSSDKWHNPELTDYRCRRIFRNQEFASEMHNLQNSYQSSADSKKRKFVHDITERDKEITFLDTKTAGNCLPIKEKERTVLKEGQISGTPGSYTALSKTKHKKNWTNRSRYMQSPLSFHRTESATVVNTNNDHEKDRFNYTTNLRSDDDKDLTITAHNYEEDPGCATCVSLDGIPPEEAINTNKTIDKHWQCTCPCVNVGMKNKFVRLRVRDMWNMSVKDMLQLAGHTPVPKNVNEITKEKTAERNMLLKRKEQRLIFKTKRVC